MAETIVLRLVHVLGGIFWIGALMYNTFFLMPAMAMAGPQASAGVSNGLRARKLFTVLPVVAVLTMLSGIRLMQLTSAGFAAAWFRSTSGGTYAMGGALAIVGFVIGMLYARPLMMRAGAMLATRGSAPADQLPALDATIAAVQRKASVASAAASVMLIASAAAMAVARYL
jgi:uncharacterized membrane protein